MSQKIAIAVIHGIGETRPQFANPEHPDFLNGIVPHLTKAFSDTLKDQISHAGSELVFEPVYWADVVQKPQNELYENLNIDEFSNVLKLRDFIFHSLADSIVYQPISSSVNEPHIYEDIHSTFSSALTKLARKAGEKAPLCIIGHSMGTAIASNFIWDTQKDKFPTNTGDTPLEKGQTFSSFYTFGSQIPFWAMRFKNFGQPIQVPSTALLEHHPLAKGEWINFYDRDDLLGYPIKNINEDYQIAVTKEKEVSVGNILTGWNPLSHNGYWENKQVTQTIADSLVCLWKQVNLS